MIDGLLGAKTDGGNVVFLCQKCRVVPDNATGAQNKDDLVYLLACPRCKRTLGEWPTARDRDDELRALADRAQKEI